MTYIHTLQVYITELAWEPSVARGTYSYSRLLPTQFFPIQVDPLHLESQNQAKNIPVVLQSFPMKIWDKSAKGFRGATKGGAAGRAPSPSTWEGGRPPLQNEKKERMAKISITGTRKPIELLHKFYYTIVSFKKNIFIFLNSQG